MVLSHGRSERLNLAGMDLGDDESLRQHDTSCMQKGEINERDRLVTFSSTVLSHGRARKKELDLGDDTGHNKKRKMVTFQVGDLQCNN